jgi:hypothetical protein
MPNNASERKSKLESYRRIKDTVLDAAIDADAAVVDGVHDRETLRRLGFSKPVYTRSKYSYSEFADRLAKKFSTVIISTDLTQKANWRMYLLAGSWRKETLTCSKYSETQ